jgi:hypothetical protein
MSSTNELLRLDVAALSAKLRSKQISPVEVTEPISIVLSRRTTASARTSL